MTTDDAPPAPPAPHRVPTLTEVIELADRAGNAATGGRQGGESAGRDLAGSAAERRAAVDRRAELERRAGRSPAVEEQIVQRVLRDLQQQIDVMLEYRLREVLGPLLARATDSVVRDARSELASTLRDVVARAVAAELARHPQGDG